MPSKIIAQGATNKQYDSREMKNCGSRKSSIKQAGYMPYPVIGVSDFENNMGSFKRMFILSLDQTLAYMEQLDSTYAKCLKKLHKMEEHLTLSQKFKPKTSNIHEKVIKSKIDSSNPIKEKYSRGDRAMSTISMEKTVSKQKMPKKSIPMPGEKLNGRISLPKNRYFHAPLEDKVVNKDGDRKAKIIHGACSTTKSRDRVADKSGPTPLDGFNVPKSSNSSRMVTKRQAKIELSTDSSSSTISPKPTLERTTLRRSLRMEKPKVMEGQPVPIHKNFNPLSTNKTENNESALQLRRSKPAPSAREIDKSRVKKVNSVQSKITALPHKSAILNSTLAERKKTLQIPSGGVETLDKRPSLASMTKIPNFGGSGFTDSLDLDKLGGDLLRADDLPEITNEVLLRDYGNYFSKLPLSRQKSTQNPAGTLDSITLSDEENFSVPASDQESVIDEAKANFNGHAFKELDRDYEKKSHSNATGDVESFFNEDSRKNSWESVGDAKVSEYISPSNSSMKLSNGKSQRSSSSENPEIFIISSDDGKKDSKARNSGQSSNSTAKGHKSDSNSDSGVTISKSNSSSNSEETDKILNSVQEDIKSISSSSSSSKGRQKRLLVKKDSFQNIDKEHSLSQSSSSNDSKKSSGNQQKPNLLSNGDFKPVSEKFALENGENNEKLSKDSSTSSSNSEKFTQKQKPKLQSNGDLKPDYDEFALKSSEKDDKLSIEDSGNNNSDKFSQNLNGKLKELINREFDEERYNRESFDSYHSSDGLSSIENDALRKDVDSSKQNGDRHGGDESADSSGSDDSSSTKSYDVSPNASNDTTSNEVSSRETRDINHVSILPSLMEEDETSGNFTDLYASDGSRPVKVNTSKVDVGHLNISLKPTLYENDLKQPTLQPDASDSETSTISLESS